MTLLNQPTFYQLDVFFSSVLGKIDPNEMGVTLSHEHLSADSRFFFVDPPKGSPFGIDKAPMTIENLGFIKNYP